ncbi:Fc.00g024160.m01.CDS01 [Cosmosporella sp. VM-42]
MMYNRDSKIMRKLLGKAAPESTSGDPNNPSITSAPTSSFPASFRPSKSQNGVYAAGVPILCLDVSPDRRAAVLGGGHILKTVVLDDPHGFNFDFHDGVDLRAIITAQPSKGNTAADQLSIRDVKWHDASNILTACANGKIFSYDLATVGSGATQPLEYIQIQEDSRQINTLDVNPHLKSWLLTGSQDGTARVFDISSPQNRGNGLTFRQRFAPLKCIDSVRQVKWSPKLGHEFACCTEGGVVLKWDIRQPARPLLRINAHEKACSSISWHPDGNHLMSAGWDSKLYVWDLGSTADKRQKPKYTVSTPAPVYAISWRPGLWSATAQSKRVAQVAVSYDNRRYGTSAVHIWDLARPTMPYKEIERFDSSPSALLWQDQDMLWTVGQDGLFNQCDVAFAPKVIDRQSTSTMAFSPKGDVLMFLDERPHSQRLRPAVTHHAEIIPRGTYGSSPNTPMLSISRSDSEEDVIGSFLGPRRRISRKRTTSARSGSNMSTTPPSGSGLPDDGKQILGLDQAIKVTGIFKSQQAMASGTIPATKTMHVYQYLSAIYLETLQRELPHVEESKSLDKRVATIIEHYARAAESVSLFRLSQTWRILAYAVGLLLKRRSQYHLEIRLGRFQKVKIEEKKGISKLNLIDYYHPSRSYGEETPRRTSRQASITGGRSVGARSLLAEEIESTSNVPTPIARPADNNGGHDDHAQNLGEKLEAVTETEDFTLGPPVHGSYSESPRRRLNSVPVSEISHDSEHSHVSSTEGYDFYDMDALTMAIDFPAPKKKEPLSLDFPGSRSPEARKVPPRHDSDESFTQMFSTSDATKQPNARTPSNSRGTWKSSLARHASDEKETEDYKSRIRGEEIETSTDTLIDLPKRPKHPAPESPEEVFMISQTTMGTDDTFPSQNSVPSPSQPEPDIQVGKPDDQTVNLAPASHPSRTGSPMRGPFPAQQDMRPYVIDTDYLPWDDDPPYPHPNSTSGPKPTISPLDPYALITRALNFESRTSALNASAMVLLLKPLVPDSVIDFYQASAVLRQHHSRLMRMSLFIEASLLRNLSIQGWPEGLPEWGENYAAIFNPAQQGVKVGFFCSSCKKPREMDPKDGASAIWTCQRCKSVMAPCAVCGHREPELSSYTPEEIAETAEAESKSWLSEWWYCPGCTHGGHASCLQSWHAALETPSDSNSPSTFSDGCCPLDGCGHACLPGKYRGETTTARSDELGRAAVEKSRAREERANSSSRRSSPRPGIDRSVKSDGNDIPQSRAVGMAREALNKTSGGILSSSPGRAVGPGERERRKSVKFAATDR